MAEKLAEVFEQYDMEILGTKKGRGAIILQTAEGLRILEPFRGSVTRLEQEDVLKQLFIKAGCNYLDQLIPNREGMLLTCDKYRQPYVLKRHFEGNECDMHSKKDIECAVRLLADFHTYGRTVALQFQEVWENSRREKEEQRIEEIQKAIADGEELERIAYLYEISPSALAEALEQREEVKEKTKQEEQRVSLPKDNREIADTFLRHNKELKKIWQFITKVKQKNAFEKLFLNVFDQYYDQGVSCAGMLPDMQQTNRSVSEKNIFVNHYGICHGAYNQHNVILGEDTAAIVHFERFSKGNQLNDLYQFARKVMEKNHFDYNLFQMILQTYARRIPLTKEDDFYFYILFSYPEKFWKIANGYYNANKAFLSPKYVEKLRMVILQENEKREMLEQYRGCALG